MPCLGVPSLGRPLKPPAPPPALLSRPASRLSSARRPLGACRPGCSCHRWDLGPRASRALPEFWGGLEQQRRSGPGATCPLARGRARSGAGELQRVPLASHPLQQARPPLEQHPVPPGLRLSLPFLGRDPTHGEVCHPALGAARTEVAPHLREEQLGLAVTAEASPRRAGNSPAPHRFLVQWGSGSCGLSWMVVTCPHSDGLFSFPLKMVSTAVCSQPLRKLHINRDPCSFLFPRLASWPQDGCSIPRQHSQERRVGDETGEQLSPIPLMGKTEASGSPSQQAVSISLARTVSHGPSEPQCAPAPSRQTVPRREEEDAGDTHCTCVGSHVPLQMRLGWGGGAGQGGSPGPRSRQCSEEVGLWLSCPLRAVRASGGRAGAVLAAWTERAEQQALTCPSPLPLPCWVPARPAEAPGPPSLLQVTGGGMCAGLLLPAPFCPPSICLKSGQPSVPSTRPGITEVPSPRTEDVGSGASPGEAGGLRWERRLSPPSRYDIPLASLFFSSKVVIGKCKHEKKKERKPE